MQSEKVFDQRGMTKLSNPYLLALLSPRSAQALAGGAQLVDVASGFPVLRRGFRRDVVPQIRAPSWHCSLAFFLPQVLSKLRQFGQVAFFEHALLKYLGGVILARCG